MNRAVLAAAAILLPRLWAQQTTPPAPAAESIPLTQIALRSEDLAGILRDIARRLPSEADLSTFDEQLSQQEHAVAESMQESEEALSSGATLAELRGQARVWRAYRSPEGRQRKVLTDWGAQCEQGAAALAQQRSIWQATLQSLQPTASLASVRARVQQSLADIRALQSVAEGRLRTVLDLQGRVAKQTSAIANISERLGVAARSFQDRLFVPEAPPIWRAWSGQQEGESRQERWVRALRRSGSNAWDFARSRRDLIAMSILALAAAFLATRWLKRNTPPGDPAGPLAAHVARRPFSLALLLCSPVVLSEVSTARLLAFLPIMPVFLLPVVRLLPPMVSYSKRAIWLTAAFYALDTLFLMFDLESSAGRELTLGLFASTLAGLAWWERRVRRRGERRKVVIIRCAIATLALIFVANALGFVLLSSLLRSWTLLGSFIALVMYTLGRTLFVFAGAFLRLPRIRSFAAVRLYERDVLKWTRRALNALMAICWTIVVLDVMAMRTDAMKALSSAVDTKAGNALGFVCVLVIGYLASKAVRFVLREDILPSMRLPRGVPETIFNGVYYISLVLFFLISLSVAGFQLDKLTVMTGALGVGVGLGLQSFVNNFVSGIVLQFERPIRIGDVLEIGTLGGEVSRIGIRSSTVRTFQGAEVVIPNSTLISNQVVNWTLTEPLRRVDLQVPIAYGTPPEQVIGILSTVAASHPEVLRNPPPGAFFQGFGASSLDFVLQFWAEQSNHFRLRSEIAIAVNAALREARIVIPFPQQDIHVRSIDAAVRENLDPAEGPRHHAVAR